MDEKKLKLIYVLKIGANSKGEGLYEFIFSLDEQNIDIEKWCWDLSPACEYATPPEKDFINKVYNLKTDSFDLFCLHEATDRPYIHGYHTIHALAYEKEYDSSDGFEQFEKMFNENDEIPLLVFHYSMSLSQVKDLLYERKIILKGNEFIESSTVDLD